MNIFILDFETSGLNPYRDDIIEIGIKKYMGDESYQTLVIPESKNLISDQITRITNITNESQNSYICCIGSFYLIGEILNLN